MLPKEVTVKIKTDEKKYQHKHLEYNDFMASDADPTIERFIRELKESIKEELIDAEIDVVIKMKLQ